jgi:hypothetical protein
VPWSGATARLPIAANLIAAKLIAATLIAVKLIALIAGNPWPSMGRGSLEPTIGLDPG